MRRMIAGLAVILVLGVAGQAGAGIALDVYDWDLSMVSPIGQIETIVDGQSGVSHYDFYSASGHPSNVNLGARFSSFWVHERSATGELTFGFIFGQDNVSPVNQAILDFRIVDSVSDVLVAVSDDPGEATETVPGAFQGDFHYGSNSDGIAVRGITGDDWTIMIDSVDFGNITHWYAASGETSDYSDDLLLTIGHQYRIVPEGNVPSGAPVQATPEPAAILIWSLLGAFGLSVRFYRRRRAA